VCKSQWRAFTPLGTIVSARSLSNDSLSVKLIACRFLFSKRTKESFSGKRVSSRISCFWKQFVESTVVTVNGRNTWFCVLFFYGVNLLPRQGISNRCLYAFFSRFICYFRTRFLDATLPPFNFRVRIRIWYREWQWLMVSEDSYLPTPKRWLIILHHLWRSTFPYPFFYCPRDHCNRTVLLWKHCSNTVGWSIRCWMERLFVIRVSEHNIFGCQNVAQFYERIFFAPHLIVLGCVAIYVCRPLRIPKWALLWLQSP